MPLSFIKSPANIFLVTLISVVAIYFTTTQDIFRLWLEDNSNYSHGILLVFIAGYIFFKKWKLNHDRLEIKVNYFYAFLLLLSVILWLAMRIMFIRTGEHFFFLTTLLMTMVTLLGIKQARPFFFPLLLLLMTIPVWTVALGTLRLITTVSTAFLLDISGIASARDGYLILISAGTFEVENACGGLNYQLAGIPIALLYAYMARMSIRTSTFYVICAFLVILLGNIVRVFTVVVIGEYSDMKSPLMDDHLWLGWVIFAIFISIFIWVSGKIIPIPESTGEDKYGGDKNRVANISMKQVGLVLMVVAINLSAPLLQNMFSLENVREKRIKLDLPVIIGQWVKDDSIRWHTNEWHPVYQKSNANSFAWYKSNGARLRLDVYYYVFQEQGREAVNVLNRAYDGKTWFAIAGGKRITDIEIAGSDVSVEEVLVRAKDGRRKMVWTWYYTNKKNIVNKKMAKFENLLSILKGNPAITVYILSTGLKQDEKTARRLLSGYLKSGLVALNKIVE